MKTQQTTNDERAAAVDAAICGLCGHPMPEGEEVFKYHGYSGGCPTPPVVKMPSMPEMARKRLDAFNVHCEGWRSIGVGHEPNKHDFMAGFDAGWNARQPAAANVPDELVEKILALPDYAEDNAILIYATWQGEDDTQSERLDVADLKRLALAARGSTSAWVRVSHRLPDEMGEYIFRRDMAANAFLDTHIEHEVIYFNPETANPVWYAYNYVLWRPIPPYQQEANDNAE